MQLVFCIYIGFPRGRPKNNTSKTCIAASEMERSLIKKLSHRGSTRAKVGKECGSAFASMYGRLQRYPNDTSQGMFSPPHDKIPTRTLGLLLACCVIKLV